METPEKLYEYFLSALKMAVAREGHGGKSFIANKAGVSPAFIGQILNPAHKTKAKVDTQKKIAQASGYSYDEFLELGKKLLSNEGVPLTVTSENGNLVGDLLHDIIFNPQTLNFSSIHEFAGRCNISVEEADQVLNSAKPPSWDLLKILFCKFGINVNFLLAGFNSDTMGATPSDWPSNQIERLAVAFGVDHYRTDIIAEKLGLRTKTVEKARKNNDLFQPELKERIISAGISTDWLTTGNFPSHMPENIPRKKETITSLDETIYNNSVDQLHENQSPVPPIKNVISVYNNVLEKTGIELSTERQEKLFNLIKQRLQEKDADATEKDLLDVISLISLGNKE